MVRSIQEKIGVSRYAMPVTAVYATVVSLLSGLLSPSSWQGFACLALTTYLMVLANNYHGFIRIYSRMASCTVLFLSTVVPSILTLPDIAFMGVCTAAFITIVFHAYQDKQATAIVCYAFCCIGVASLCVIQTLWLIPVFWVLMATKMQMLSWHTLIASILGTLAPYWFYGGWLLFEHGEITSLLNHFTNLSQFNTCFQCRLIDMRLLPIVVLATMAGIIGSIHFVHTCLQDKIRTRMIYEFLIFTSLATLLLLLLFPQHAAAFTTLLIVFVSPLFAHFSALSKGKFGNWVFIIFLLSTLAVTFYNIYTC